MTEARTDAHADDRTDVASRRLSAPERSLGELVALASKDLSLLVSQEIALAKAEIKRDVSAAGKGAGLLGGAGFTGFFALLFLSIALAFAIGKPTTLGVGFLVVGLLYLVAAAVLGLSGKKQIGRVGTPEKTIATLKDDAAWVRHPTRAS